MTGKRLAIVSLVSLPLFAASSHAMAQDVRILRGTMSQPGDFTGDLSVEGASGVRIDASLDGRHATLAWDRACHYFGCQPGEVVSLGAAYGGAGVLPGSGQVTIHGQTYSLWSPGGANAQFQFDGAIVLPDFTSSGTAELSAPFAFSGSLQIPNAKQPGTYDVFNLRGSGVATAFVSSRGPYVRDAWTVGGVIYEFAPRVVVTPQ